MSGTKIMWCSCEHTFQDEKYGKNKRVHNFAVNSNNKAGGWRCTVCEKVKSKDGK